MSVTTIIGIKSGVVVAVNLPQLSPVGFCCALTLISSEVVSEFDKTWYFALLIRKPLNHRFVIWIELPTRRIFRAYFWVYVHIISMDAQNKITCSPARLEMCVREPRSAIWWTYYPITTDQILFLWTTNLWVRGSSKFSKHLFCYVHSWSQILIT